MKRLLIVEDEAVIRTALRRLLERSGYTVEDAGSVPDALQAFDLGSFDLVIADLRLPGPPGTDLIGLAVGTPVLIMTSYASVQSAVDAMKLGAADYIAKPFEHDELLLVIERVLRQRRLERQNAALRADLERAYPLGQLIGCCPSMQEVFDRIRRVAPTDATVLILGESGTGKELVARAVHEESGRREQPMITVNCAAIPETLIESELFGVEAAEAGDREPTRKGVGLVESADRGTLFLDEIGELPLAAQARLLRVLQDGEVRRIGSPQVRRVDVRLIAATHRDLGQLVAEGAFRADLYFRLRVMEIRLPPLRERGEDIPELAEFLLGMACTRLNRPSLRLSPEALTAIRRHRWPGNVRELENAIERAVILCDGEVIGPELLGIEHVERRSAPALAPADAGGQSLEDYFRAFVLANQDHMTETELARRLGISRKALWERRQRLGVPRPRH
jgi:DNA-binding NtrC family response regulator